MIRNAGRACKLQTQPLSTPRRDDRVVSSGARQRPAAPLVRPEPAEPILAGSFRRPHRASVRSLSVGGIAGSNQWTVLGGRVGLPIERQHLRDTDLPSLVVVVREGERLGDRALEARI